MPTQQSVLAPHGWTQCRSSFGMWFFPAQLTFTPSSGNNTPYLYFRDLSSPTGKESCSHHDYSGTGMDP